MIAKKILVMCLAIIIAVTSILVSCKQEDVAKVGCVSFHHQCEETIVVWWDTEGVDYYILSDAWYDFRNTVLKTDEYKDKGYTDKINMFAVPGDPNGTSLIEMQITSGTAPDLIKMDHVYLTKLGYGNNVFDINKVFNANGTIKELFIKSCWDASSYVDPKTGIEYTYGIPFDANTIIWGGKSQYLKAADVTLPQNYNEILNVGNKLKALDVDVLPYTLPCGTDTRFNWPSFVFMLYVWRLGGDILSEDMSKAIFNNPETGVKALKMMIEMGDADIISKDKYQEGEPVLCDYGTWKLNTFNEDMEFSLLPELKEGVKRYSGLGLYSLSVVSTATNPQLAYDFAVHLATKKNTFTDEYYQYMFTKNHNLLPSLIDASETTVFKDATQTKFWQVSLEQLKLSRYRPPVPCWDEIEEIISKSVTQAITHDKSPEEVLDTAANQVNNLLEKYQGK